MEAFKSATLVIRRAFWYPRIALPTTRPETAAVATSCTLWDSEALEIHEGILVVLSRTAWECAHRLRMYDHVHSEETRSWKGR